MSSTYDPEKRAKTLAERDLDFEDAAVVFAGEQITNPDDRSYGEPRFNTAGKLGDRMVIT